MKKTFTGYKNDIALEVLDWIRDNSDPYDEVEIILEIINNN